MSDMLGDTFVSQGIKYVLLRGVQGNLRPYTVGPVAALARTGASLLPKLAVAGLAIGAVAFVGWAIWSLFQDDDDAELRRLAAKREAAQCAARAVLARLTVFQSLTLRSLGAGLVATLPMQSIERTRPCGRQRFLLH